MSVDLPAPFSPTRAWISPGMIVRSTPSNASVLRKRFVRPLILIAGSASVSMAVRLDVLSFGGNALLAPAPRRRRLGERRRPVGHRAGFRPLLDRWETNVVAGLALTLPDIFIVAGEVVAWHEFVVLPALGVHIVFDDEKHRLEEMRRLLPVHCANHGVHGFVAEKRAWLGPPAHFDT